MMEVKDLSFSYKKNDLILEDIAFKAYSGQCLGILGNNGAGKSTILKCLTRILKADQGIVYLDGEKISHLPLRELAKKMAFVAQDFQNSQLTVFDMLMLGRRPYIKWGLTDEDKKIVEEVLEEMDLGQMAVRYVNELSGGEQQKVMLARALVQKPKVLLLDEPTSNLDLRNQYEMLDLVKGICQEKNIILILVIHDLNLALRYCDRFILLKDRQIYAQGGLEAINQENIEAVYQIKVKICQIEGRRILLPLISL